jgi:hypothetical protein
MSLNTYNKNVDIIWHYCIISKIKLHTWFLKTISSHKYEERRIEVYDKKVMIWHFSYHMSYQPETPILARRPEGWYGMWYGKCHIIIYNYDVKRYLITVVIYLKFDTNGQLSTRLYDKRDDFSFAITSIHFPHLDSNIPTSLYFTTTLELTVCIQTCYVTVFWVLNY